MNNETMRLRADLESSQREVARLNACIAGVRRCAEYAQRTRAATMDPTALAWCKTLNTNGADILAILDEHANCATTQRAAMIRK